MAQETFGQIWNRVLLFAPDCPPPLAQNLVRDCYLTDVQGAHMWSELKVDYAFLLPVAYTTGTVAVTKGSASATVGGGGNWTGFENRQFAPNGLAPWYTIVTVAVGGATITLDRAYEGASATITTYYVAQLYFELPSDLWTIDEMRDLSRNIRLTHQIYPQGYIDMIDPKRSSSGGTPIIISAAPPRVDASTGEVTPRYEFWPKNLVAKEFLVRYYKTHALSTNATRLIAMLNPSVLVYGALMRLCLIPKIGAAENPYHDMDLFAKYKLMMEDSLQSSEMADINRAQTMVQADSEALGFPMSAKFMQEHGIVL